LNDAVVHERQQAYHGTQVGLELWSTGAKAVSFLPSRPCANLICGVEQLPKLGPVLDLRKEPFPAGVELGDENEEVWQTG